MIHHIALFARRPDEMAAFYSKVLEIPEIRRTEDAEGLYSVWLQAGTSILMIERADREPVSGAALESAETQPAHGLRPVHRALIAFSLSPHKESAFRERLTAAGGSIVRRTEFSLYFADPEGNALAVSWYRQ